MITHFKSISVGQSLSTIFVFAELLKQESNRINVSLQPLPQLYQSRYFSHLFSISDRENDFIASFQKNSVYFEGGYQECDVFLLENLLPGHSIPGPAVIIDKLGTIIVEPGCTAEMTTQGDLQILIQTLQTSEVGLELDAGKYKDLKHLNQVIPHSINRFIGFFQCNSPYFHIVS